MESTRALLEGQNGFFHSASVAFVGIGVPGPPTRPSFYDTRPLRATLERFADF